MTENNPSELETAFFSPSIVDDDILCQSVAIAPLENREVSIIFSKMRKGNSSFAQFWFTEKEVDLLISALQECKVRWDRGEAIC